MLDKEAVINTVERYVEIEFSSYSTAKRILLVL